MGEEALRLLERERPVLAVLDDVVMPNWEAEATSAQLPGRFPGWLVIFASGYSQDSTGLLTSGRRMKCL